jgi:hypothetical protein
MSLCVRIGKLTRSASNAHSGEGNTCSSRSDSIFLSFRHSKQLQSQKDAIYFLDLAPEQRIANPRVGQLDSMWHGLAQSVSMRRRYFGLLPPQEINPKADEGGLVQPRARQASFLLSEFSYQAAVCSFKHCDRFALLNFKRILSGMRIAAGLAEWVCSFHPPHTRTAMGAVNYSRDARLSFISKLSLVHDSKSMFASSVS